MRYKTRAVGMVQPALLFAEGSQSLFWHFHQCWFQFFVSEMVIRMQYGPNPAIPAALLILYPQANWVCENPAFSSQIASCSAHAHIACVRVMDTE